MTTQTLKHTKYASPEQIAGDDTITHTQKMELLEQWAQDARAKARASSEGMDGGDPNELSRVQNILEQMEAYGK